MSIEEAQTLPAGWRWIRLGDAATYYNGRAFKPEDWATDGIPIIRIQNLNSPTAAYNYFKGEIDPRNSVNDGDLLISWSASLDAFLWDRGPAVLNQHIFKVEEYSDKIDRRYLYFAVKEAMAEIRDQVHGATMKHITKPEFEAIKIPLPPIPEQKRIATVLTAKMAAVEKARAAAEERLKASKELPAAYLREVFESEEAQGWPRMKVRDFLSSPLNTGISKPASPSSDIACLTLSSVRNGVLDLDARKSVAVSPKEAARNWVKPGAFYVVRGNGNLSLVGRGALAPDSMEVNVLYPDLLIEVNPDPQVVFPDYLSMVWNTDEVRNQVEEAARTSAGIYKINLQNLGNISIPVPEVNHQRSITKTVSNLAVGTSSLIDNVAEETMTIKALPAALLRQAFAGEL